MPSHHTFPTWQLYTAAISLSAVVGLACSAATFYSLSRQQAIAKLDSDDNDGTKNDSASGSSDGGDKRWKIVHEYWSEQSYGWKAGGADDEDDENANLLFIIRDRKPQNPKTDQPCTLIEIKSRYILVFFRCLMKGIPELCGADTPQVNSQELFHCRQLFKACLEGLQLALDNLEADQLISSSMVSIAIQTDPVSPTLVSDSTTGGASSSTALNDASTTEPTSDSIIKEFTELLRTDDTLVKLESDFKKGLTTAVDHLKAMDTWQQLQFKPIEEQVNQLMAEGKITYPLLWSLFKEGDKVVTSHETSGQELGLDTKTVEYTEHYTVGACFQIEGEHYIWNGTQFSQISRFMRIPKFKGTRKIARLSVRPLGEEKLAELRSRGKLALELCGVHHMSYTGNIYQIRGSCMNRQIIRKRADGRSMVDASSFNRMNSGNEISFELLEESTRGTWNTLDDEDHWLLPPTVLGFSLALKEWGEFLVTGFSKIVWDAHAYDHLVLEASSKGLVKALVESTAQELSAATAQLDVISGKGGGFICVLHGRPGTGKTLTAEAVAEHLHRPLYSVSSASLGGSPDDIETRLRDTLELSHLWNACILIDEADVFLEQRGEHETARNAMVAVFLRLLEYHQSIMFLTTNRLTSFDEAFISRFNLAIRYPDLDQASRKLIWRKFMDRAQVNMSDCGSKAETDSVSSSSTAVGSEGLVSDISDEFLVEMSRMQFNGRSIKNHIKTAQALAASAGEVLCQKHLRTVISSAEQFKNDFQEVDHKSAYHARGEGPLDRLKMYN